MARGGCTLPAIVGGEAVAGQDRIAATVFSDDGGIADWPLLHHDLRRRAPGAGGGELLQEAVGDRAGRLCMRARRLRADDRLAAVRGLADRDIERDLAQELDAEPLGLFPGAAVREDLAPLPAMRAREVAHVLDDPEHWHVDLAEHVQTL